MKRHFEATMWREGEWWVIDVPGIGATQVRSLTTRMIATKDMIRAALGHRYFSVDIKLRQEEADG